MISAGQTIGNYRIISKIGTGGMGAVYLAEHPLIGKKVALKVIHRELASNREVVQRFFQEARAVNKIGNEHIVEIHDFGVTPDNDHFYIMEYLEGKTLASVLSRETKLSVMRALHVGAQIASALGAAHASGVIHRDLKPDNIMLMTRLGDPDFVKVLDFGLAKMFQGGGASAVQTAAGVLLGTPQYMSPEACESKRDIDHRTDIYALGVLLFQMMTGVLPFDGQSMGEVLVKQVTALPPAPRGLNPEIQPSVEQVLLRCLAKQPDARFATMSALREALLDPEAYLHKSPPMAAARSVAPGEGPDARQVAAYVNAQQQEKTMMAGGGAMPLPAPQPSQWGNAPTMMHDGSAPAAPTARKPTAVPGLVQPVQPKSNTMRIATPLGHSSRPPRKMWPIVLVIGLLLGLGGGAFAVAWFGRRGTGNDPGGTGSGSGGGSTTHGATASGSAGSGHETAGSAGSTNGIAGGSSAGSAHGSSAGSAHGSGDSVGSGAGAHGTTAGSGTSVGSGAGAHGTTAGSGASAGSGAGSAHGTTAGSGTSAGSGAGSAHGTTAGSGASAGSGAGSAHGMTAGSGAGSAHGMTAGSGAGSAHGTSAGSGSAHGAGSAAGSNAGSAQGTGPGSGLTVTPILGPKAKIAIDSIPAGASVYAADGTLLGKTPLKLEWPISTSSIKLELRLAGYKRKQKEIVIRGNTAISIDLERQAAPPPGRGSGTGPGKGSGKPNDGLLRPEDL